MGDCPPLWRGVVACFGSVLLTAACSSTPSTWAVPVSVEPASFTVHEPRVFEGECLFPPDERQAAIAATLGGLFLQSAAGAAFTALGTALEEAGTEKTFSYSVSRALVLTPQTDPSTNIKSVDFPACIQLIQGPFYDRIPEGKEPTWTLPGLRPQTDNPAARLWEIGIPLAGPPDLMFEFAPIVDGSSIAFELTYIDYTQRVGGRAVDDGSARTLAVELAFSDPGTAITDATPKGQLVIGSLSPPFAYKYFGPKGELPRQTNWLSLVTNNEQAARATINKTLRISVVETDPGNPFLKALGTSLKGKATTVETEVGRLVLPSERAAAENQALAAKNTALNNFFTAWAAAEEAVASCNSAAPGPDRRKLCITALGKQRSANVLAKLADVSSPYGDNDLVKP